MDLQTKPGMDEASAPETEVLRHPLLASQALRIAPKKTLFLSPMRRDFDITTKWFASIFPVHNGKHLHVFKRCFSWHVQAIADPLLTIMEYPRKSRK